MVYTDKTVTVDYKYTDARENMYTEVRRNTQKIIDLETGVEVYVDIDPTDEWEELMLEIGV